MKSKIFNILNLLFALVMGIGVMSFAQACGAGETGSWMECRQTQMYLVFLAAFMGILSLTSIYLRTYLLNLIIGIINIGISVVSMLLPGTLMAMCTGDDMRCHTVMRPFVTVFGLLIIIASVLSIIFGFIRRRR